MDSIQVINKLTPEQWESVYANNHLSDAYRSNNSDRKKLEIELANRVMSLCGTNLPIPKKIVITYDLSDSVKMMNSGELRIHPLSFVACNLNRNTMTVQQEAFYNRLVNYVVETKNFINLHFDSIEYKQAAKELMERYRTELANDLQNYKYIVPKTALNEAIVGVLLMHKACRYPTITPTMAKLASASIAALNGLAAGWMIGKFTSDSMYLPVAGSGALLVAGVSYIGLNIAERIGRVVAMAFDQDIKSFFLKPWEERTLESKMSFSRTELLKGEILPRL